MNDQIRSEFAVSPERIYLDAATYGLPPRAAVEAYRAAIDGWETGAARFETDWEPAGEACRALFARLIGTESSNICLLPSVSAGIGTVAASLPAGSVVLAAEDEFTSTVLPFAGAGTRSDITIRTVPWEELIAAIDGDIDLVAVSLTRAQDGRTIDLGALIVAAARHGTRVVIDATHALPFVPVRAHLSGIDFLVCHGYKHLLSPRGTAFGYINPRFLPYLAPIHANWRTVGRSYGLPLGPVTNASAFDISLAWHAWVGTQPALERLVAWSGDGTVAASLELAKRLARQLEVPEPTASLVCVPADAPEALVERLEEHGLRAAGRGAYLRLSTHVWNTEDEIDRAAALVNSMR
jgi:selenocysteine lyase/cysteine desulfurase